MLYISSMCDRPNVALVCCALTWKRIHQYALFLSLSHFIFYFSLYFVALLTHTQCYTLNWFDDVVAGVNRNVIWHVTIDHHQRPITEMHSQRHAFNVLNCSHALLSISSNWLALRRNSTRDSERARKRDSHTPSTPTMARLLPKSDCLYVIILPNRCVISASVLTLHCERAREHTRANAYIGNRRQ